MSHVVLHTARTVTTGGREQGGARSCDGLLDVRLASPGSVRMGANPEQLFGVAWSASFASAIATAARQSKVELPASVTIEATVALCLAGDACFLRVRLRVSLPGVDRVVGQVLVDQAQRTCAYSNAARSVDVAINLV